MEFKINEKFNVDNEYSKWVLNLLIIRNDFKNSIMYFMDNRQSYDSIDSSRFMYHVRILLVHYREALKYLSKSIEIAKAFFDFTSSIGGLEKYQSLVNYAEPYSHSFLKDFCVPKRNVIAHYSENDDAIVDYLKLVDKNTVCKVRNYEKNWSERHYDFADEIIQSIVFTDMKNENFINNLKTFIDSSRYLIDLIDYIYDEYMELENIQ